MPTTAKIAAVEDLRGRLGGARTVVLTDYRGLTVQQLNELRRQLRGVSAQYKVVKNRLARRAATEAGLAALSPYLTGPTAMVVTQDDPVAVAKTLQTFARTNQALAIKAGYVDGQVLAPEGVRVLAELPSRDALRSQLIGVLEGPSAQLVGLLTAPLRELVYILEQRGKGAGEA